MRKKYEDEILRQFLLGNLPESVADEIGVQLLTDRSLDYDLQIAEEVLADEFVLDMLDADELELFHANFLTTPERQELVEDTLLLRDYALSQLEGASPVAAAVDKPGIVETIRDFFASNLRPIAAAALLVIVVGAGWRIFFYDAGGLTQLEKDYVAINAKDLANPSEIVGFANKSLVAGTLRDTDALSRLRADSLTGDVLFRLALPTGTPRDKPFDLELTANGQTVFRQPGLRVFQNQNGEELKVVVPRSLLAKGNYQLRLNNGLSYAFAVE